MNEQEKAARFSAQVDRLLHTPAEATAGDTLPQDDQALLELAREMAAMDFSTQSQFLRSGRQPKGETPMLSGLFNGRRVLVTLGATVFLLILAFTFVAPMRAFAQDAWQSLFVRDENNRIAVESSAPIVGPTSTPVPAGDAVGGMSVAEAQELASFRLKEPAGLPAGFALSSVYYDEAHDKVTFLYLNDAFLGIVLHQQPAGTAERFTIGAEAEVESVTVNGVRAEYVRGSWGWLEPEGGLVVSDEVEWRADDPYQQLRWVADGNAYTLSTTVGQDLGLSQADLIAIAESLR